MRDCCFCASPCCSRWLRLKRPRRSGGNVCIDRRPCRSAAGGEPKQGKLTRSFPRHLKKRCYPPSSRTKPEITTSTWSSSASRAAGVPCDWWLSIGNLVSWQLEKVIPHRRVRVKILAAAGETLEKQHEKLSTLSRRPDVLIVYAGHNEFSARFPWSREIRHYDDDKQPGLWELLVQQVESRSPVCGLIREEADKCRVAIPPPAAGYRKLVQNLVLHAGRVWHSTLRLRRRLEAIVEFAQHAGALPILISPPANDSDYEPNRSYLPPQTMRPSAKRSRVISWRRVQLEESDPQQSLVRYPRSWSASPGSPIYTIGWHAMYKSPGGDWEQAYRHALASRDLDGFPHACPLVFRISTARWPPDTAAR